MRALVRPPGASFPRALSSHPQKASLDLARALEQHHCYTEALRSAGLEVHRLEPRDEFPDSVFIEDNAVILDGRALVCPMAAPSRRAEVKVTRRALEKFLPVTVLEDPVQLDGGDVLQTESTVFVGLSSRSNAAAVDALQRWSARPVVPVAVQRGLHLKSAVSAIGGGRLVIDPACVDTGPLRDFEWIEVSEPGAANCLDLGGTVLVAAGHPGLEAALGRRGYRVLPVPISEFEKADGGLTCLSLIF